MLTLVLGGDQVGGGEGGGNCVLDKFTDLAGHHTTASVTHANIFCQIVDKYKIHQISVSKYKASNIEIVKSL